MKVNITDSFYLLPHACIVVYSIVDKDSFIKAQDILQYLAKQSCNDKRARILVGNKVDLQRSRQVSIQGKASINEQENW